MPDASMLAFCLDKPDAQFTADEIQLAKSELPVVKSLSEKHFEQEFLSKLKERPGTFTQIERIQHLQSNRVIESSVGVLTVRREVGYHEAAFESEAILTSSIVSLGDEHYLEQRIRPRNSVSVKHYQGIINRALAEYPLSKREQPHANYI
ncbi:hypothetical protein [Halomonas binhaiensis]|uniref:Uncharacterized protein n=1 Tax=Halomonas binhaiensis TaxID=2562282 RepID=A0A5C1NKD3_9GAMM|nr:hypothetical protein [Halomonas binhaiensis]QEM82269.1 hypothetical protein E4T21_12470 [Halomonas binhaiensis]